MTDEYNISIQRPVFLYKILGNIFIFIHYNMQNGRTRKTTSRHTNKQAANSCQDCIVSMYQKQPLTE